MRFSTYFLHILPLTVYIFYLFLSKNRSIILFMKTQLILSISVVAAVSLLASCSSTKVQPDTYDNSETVTIFKIDSASATASNEDSYSEEKLNSARSFSDKLLNKNKYDKKEEMTCFLTPTLGKPFARKGAFIHKNGTDLAGFFILYDTSFYAFYLAKTDCSGHRIVFWCMVLKLCNVPVFLLIFLVAAGFFVMMLPLIPFLVLFDYFLLLSTSMYGISGLLKCGKEGRLSGKAVAMNIVLQFVFCADVLSAVYCCFKTREKADSNE